MPEPKLELGMTGVSLAPIAKDDQGWAFIYDLKQQVKVVALEDVRLHRELLVVELPNHVLEHTPEELKYETKEKTWERVGEEHPLPCGGGYATPASIQATASGNTEVIAPSGAAKKLKIKDIFVFNSGAASITVYLRDGAAGDARFQGTLAPNTFISKNLTGCNWKLTAGNSLYVNLSAIGTVDVTVMKDEVD